MKRRREKNKKLLQKVFYRLIMALGVLVRGISREKSTAIARFFGDFGYDILKIRRKLVMQNLALTVPENIGSEISFIACQVYRNQAENVIEILRLPMIKSSEDAARLMNIDARDFMAKTIDQQKGGVLLSAHFGNWELLGLCAGLLVTPVSIIVKRLKNNEIDRKMNLWRTMHGNRIIYNGQALREGLRTLQNGGILSILGDQSDPNGSFFTEFPDFIHVVA